MQQQRFPKTIRLRKSDDFARVYRSKIYAADQVLVITARVNGTEHSRMGMSVSRQVGNAVVRNQWKRHIREAFRTQRNRIPDGLDFVVRPRKGANCDHQAIRRSLINLLERIQRKC